MNTEIFSAIKRRKIQYIVVTVTQAICIIMWFIGGYKGSGYQWFGTEEYGKTPTFRAVSLEGVGTGMTKIYVCLLLIGIICCIIPVLLNQTHRKIFMILPILANIVCCGMIFLLVGYVNSHVPSPHFSLGGLCLIVSFIVTFILAILVLFSEKLHL